MDFHYKRAFAAENGQDGGTRNCTGRDGADVVIKVPAGTIVRDAASGKIMADLAAAGDRRIIIKGGKGGKGNQHFATAARQAPRFAERGRQAGERDLILELKLIADVGLIGLPNVGKSSLLSMATNANPKIANYHFTTLTPNLGVVRGPGAGAEDFVLADIPGLVEGASEGAGLGHKFLRHIERTKVLIHVVDASGQEGGDVLEGIETINGELRLYGPELVARPRIIAANKIDLTGARENYQRIKRQYEPQGVRVFAVSAATGEGIDGLLAAAAQLLRQCPGTITFSEDYQEYAGKEPEPIIVEKKREHYFVVSGIGIDRMLGYTNLDTEKGNDFFQKFLQDRAINKRLLQLGVQDGDTVLLGSIEFEFYN
jgi:GTP-binding protein